MDDTRVLPARRKIAVDEYLRMAAAGILARGERADYYSTGEPAGPGDGLLAIEVGDSRQFDRTVKQSF